MTGTPQPAEAPRDPARPPAKDMAWIPGGTFRLGSEDFYPEERPVHTVTVDPFWMDEHPVTVADFRRFVKATGYVTTAERPLDPAEYPDADPALLVPGSLVFQGTRGPVRLDDYRQWWAYIPGASWRHPEGPGSTTAGRDRHPVTQVAFEDVEAYAKWTGKSLATEAEWECAARGGVGRQALRVGRRVRAAWPEHGQHLAGRVPVAEHPGRRVCRYVAGALVPTERLRPVPPRRARANRWTAAPTTSGSAASSGRRDPGPVPRPGLTGG